MNRFLEKTACFLIFACLILSGSRPKAQTFVEVSSQLGIDAYGVDRHIMGGGVAFFDYNQDYYPDIFVVGGERSNALYRNNWDGTFSNVSKQAGVELPRRTTYGIAVGDVDNDGDEDIFLTTGVNEPNILLENQGDGTFVDISRVAGIREYAWSTSASLGDIDQDGLLDIYVANYADFVAYPFASNIDQCTPNFLYKNLGNNKFVDVATEMGVADVGCGLAVALTDCDNDHDIDIHVVNDFGGTFEPNELYLNQFPSPGFSRSPAAANIQVGINGMGIAIGDPDEDGDWDYYVTNMGDNPFFENQQDGYFQDVAHSRGVANPDGTSWGTAFFDFQNDTYLDLLVANGEVVVTPHQNHENRLFLGSSHPTFANVSQAEGLSNPSNCRGLSIADYDNDGDLDLMFGVIAREENAHSNTLIYQNRQASENHWLKVKLQGTQSHRNGYGSRLRVVMGERSLIREADGGSSYLSHNSHEIHVGLGQSKRIDSLLITWPGGHQDVYLDLVADQQVIAIEDRGLMPYSHQIASIQQGDSVLLGNDFETESGIYHQKIWREDASDSALLITKLQVIDPPNNPKSFFVAPNPFQGISQLHYSLSEESQVSISVYSMDGRQLQTFFDEPQPKGAYVYQLDQFSFAAGLYVFRLQINTETYLAKAVKVE